MKILTTQQIRELDAHTIEHEPVASIDLMERASRAFVEWLTLRIDASRRIGVVCGTGNNGGDGLAIARLLSEWSYPVHVWIVNSGGHASTDFTINRQRLPGKVGVTEITSSRDAPAFRDCDVLIDAIFGSGLTRPAEGVYAHVIEVINKTEATRVAVDIPSGLKADSHSEGPIVKADFTVAFQLPKLAFFLPEAFPYTGEWTVVDIGLDKEFVRNAETPYYYVRMGAIRKVLKTRSKFDHKGTYGNGLLIAGSHGKLGAAVLAARAALRAGIGLLSVHVPACGYPILQTAVPEAMCQVDSDDRVLSTPPPLEGYDALGIGPGLGQDNRTKLALAKTLEKFGKPVVLDADALNILAADRHLLTLVPPGSILTPHPREFERLAGPWSDDFQRLEIQKQLAVSLKSIIVLKGAHTSIASDKGSVHFNSTGNPGMATAGSGDVLTGILTGLLAQGYSPLDAALAGVFLHGLAGDLAANDCGPEAMIASDLIDRLPLAYRKLHRK